MIIGKKIPEWNSFLLEIGFGSSEKRKKARCVTLKILFRCCGNAAENNAGWSGVFPVSGFVSTSMEGIGKLPRRRILPNLTRTQRQF